MRKLILLTAVVCLISCCGMTAWSQPSEVESGLSRYVGPSKAKTDGNAGGMLGMNALCQASFGTTAHICTLDQFYWTAAAKPTEVLPTMWIMPSYHNCVYDPAIPGIVCQLGISQGWFEPVQSVTNFECNSWGSSISSDTGLSVFFTSGTSTVVQDTCDSKQHVACCAP